MRLALAARQSAEEGEKVKLESNEENTFSRKSALWREKIGNWLREEGYYLISVRDRDLAINCLRRKK